jgi:hypothetical protein
MLLHLPPTTYPDSAASDLPSAYLRPALKLEVTTFRSKLMKLLGPVPAKVQKRINWSLRVNSRRGNPSVHDLMQLELLQLLSLLLLTR